MDFHSIRIALIPIHSLKIFKKRKQEIKLETFKFALKYVQKTI